MIILGFLLSGLRISVPYVLAALGGTVCERSGVVNLGLEAMLLVGAFAATVGAQLHGVLAGALLGMLGGVGVAAIYAVCVLRGKADQIVAGVALNMLAIGVTRYLLKLIFHSASSSPDVPGIDGPGAEVFVAGAALLAVGVQLWMSHTPEGLRLRAVGEHPEAADSLGVDVVWTRARAILSSGALAGLGGAWLALNNHGFGDKMSAGRGYIAIAAVIFGRWMPLGAAGACLLFGFADALQIQLQNSFANAPRELLQILPYVVTIAALAFRSRSLAPRALGVPWKSR